MPGEAAAVSAVATLLTKVFGFVVEPNGLAKMKQEKGEQEKGEQEKGTGYFSRVKSYDRKRDSPCGREGLSAMKQGQWGQVRFDRFKWSEVVF